MTLFEQYLEQVNDLEYYDEGLKEKAAAILTTIALITGSAAGLNHLNHSAERSLKEGKPIEVSTGFKIEKAENVGTFGIPFSKEKSHLKVKVDPTKVKDNINKASKGIYVDIENEIIYIDSKDVSNFTLKTGARNSIEDQKHKAGKDIRYWKIK